MKRIARVFPRKTALSPEDDLAFFDSPGLYPPEVDEVHVSVSFSWDLQEAERLAREWERIAPVRIGGPALGDRGEEFTPGLYLREGVTITSRGCPHRCAFCGVWKANDGKVREFPIREGRIIQDDNLLACSRSHIESVFRMLKEQKGRRRFNGGLDASLLEDWHLEQIAAINPDEIFFAYDRPEMLDTLKSIIEPLRRYHLFSRRKIRCFVLIGFGKDTIEKARDRLFSIFDLGFMPYAMLYRSKDGKDHSKEADWRRLKRVFSRPPFIKAASKERFK